MYIEGIVTGRVTRFLALEALAGGTGVPRPADALAAHAFAVRWARTQQPPVHIAHEVVALAEPA